MSRAVPSQSLEAAVRAHFGLSQDELAHCLGVTRAQVAHLEAGRRQATAATSQPLQWLAQLLPPPTGTGPAAPAFAVPAGPPAPAADALLAALPAFGALPAAALERRWRQVLAQAARLRWARHRAGKAWALQARRQWGLAVLWAAPPAEALVPAEQAHRAHWLATLAADVAAAAASPATRAAEALAVVRLLGLDLEAAALARLLAAR